MEQSRDKGQFFSVRRKILLGLAAISVIYMITVAGSYLMTGNITSIANEITPHAIRMKLLQEFSLSLQDSESNLDRWLATGYTDYEEKINTDIAGMLGIIGEIKKHPAGDNETLLLSLESMVLHYKEDIVSLSGTPASNPGERNAGIAHVYDELDSMKELTNAKVSLHASNIDSMVAAQVMMSQALIDEMLIMGTLILISGIVVAFLLTRSITRPLSEFGQAAGKMASGDMSVRVVVKNRDEFGELASSFNMMAAEIEKAHKNLQSHAEDLERKVQERTAAVEQKLSELTETKTAIVNMMDDMDGSNRELVVTKGDLEESLRKLQEVDTKKDEFISIAAHELKTPLTSIHGFSQLLRDSKISIDTEKRNKYLEIIDKESMRLAKLVSEILDLSRIDMGTIRFALEEVDLNALSESLLKEMDGPIKAKGLKLESSIEKNLPKISTDRERLTQVVINLLTNAMKYTPSGKIMLAIGRDGANVRFSVKDTGIGIAKENHSRIFQRFYQVDSSYTRSAGGTGLGLSLCKEFVTKLGGEIWFESAFGKGSEFIFTLPLKVPDSVRRYEKEGIDLPVEAKKKAEKDTATGKEKQKTALAPASSPAKKDKSMQKKA
jgi:signal transduction histidine kinase